MRAVRRVGLRLSWSTLTAVFLADVAILIGAGRLPESWQGPNRTGFWVAVGMATLLTLLSIVSYRRMTIAQRLAPVLQPPGSRWPALSAGCVPASNHLRRFGFHPVGVRESGGHLVTVIAVDGPLSVRSAVAGLRQFDIRLSGLDLVCVRLADGTHGSWIVARMDAQHTVAAVAIRDSLAATVTAATDRLAEHCGGRPLTADEIDGMDATLLAGLEPEARRPKDLADTVRSFWVTPSDVTTATLERLWDGDAEAIAVVVRLSAARSARPRISAWVRYHGSGSPAAEVCAGLNRLTGRDLAAIRAGLAVPRPRPVLEVPGRELGADEEIVVAPR